jgi:molybdenum cofactor cytidylyltransferase
MHMPESQSARRPGAAPRVAAVVVAAGLSQRMGTFKPLLELGGKPLLQHVVEALQSSGHIEPIVVVTGHEESRLRAAMAGHPLTWVHNAAYADGEMLASVKAGVRALPAGTSAVVLALGDQPAVSMATIARLTRAWQDAQTPMVLPVFQGRRGHPLVLAASLWPEILALGLGETLKTLVHRHLGEALQVAVEDPAVLADLDTPEDYERARREWDQRAKER